MELLLIRHGRPRGDHVPAPGEGADPPLSEAGRAEAVLLGHYLAAGTRPRTVYASPMLRAAQTAEAIAGAIGGLTPVLDDRLREFDDGAPHYTPVEPDEGDPAVRRAQWAALETGHWGTHRFDPDAFERRVQAAFNAVIAAHPAQTVAVVCHGGVLNSWLGAVLRRPRGMFFQPAYTSLSRVAVSRSGHRQVLSLNETTHLQLTSHPVVERI